jgi:membrane-associated phospholipid phosphatase
MDRSGLKSNRLFRTAALCAAFMVASAGASAQSSQPAEPREDKPAPIATPSPTPKPERRFFRNILRDQRAIWTSPFRLGRGDARWVAPLGAATLALLVTDQYTGRLSDDRRRISVSRDISEAGSIYATGGLAGAFYLAGRMTGNARARETGLLGAEALVNSQLAYSVLKNVSQRPRPTIDGAHAEFFDGGHSFPSGHATSAWALATVVANEYHDRRAVQVVAYGLATAVSASRYTARRHFLSDVLVGSAIGYGIGRYVYKTHHDPSLDAPGARVVQSGEAEGRLESARSKFMPLVAPSFSRAEREYGLTLAWSF